MSFFSNIFSSSKQEPHDDSGTFWNKMCSTQDLQEAVEASHSQTVVIFKHSTRCFISKTVLRQFENQVKNSQSDARFYYLDLLACRDLSNLIASKFAVTHQSPQLLVLKQGKVARHASHQDISLSLVEN